MKLVPAQGVRLSKPVERLFFRKSKLARMRKSLLRSLFFVALLSLAATAEPVARVQSIEGAGNLFVQRKAATKWFRAHKEMAAEVGDHLRTDEKSLATLRFLLGGRANLDKGSEIAIISNRDVDVVSRTISLKKGTFWAQFDKQKTPVKIQTAGGVMGIRGTEFVVQVDDEGNTVLSMLEGEVEVDPAVGSTTRALPGSRVSFGPDTEISVLFEKLDELRQQLEAELPALSELQDALDQVDDAMDLTQVQLGKVNAALAGLDGLEDRLNGRSSGKSRLPSLRADWPKLSWSNIESPRFAVLVLPGEGDDNVLWLDETSEHNYVYPSDASPLNPGSYRYRIIPLDRNSEVQAEGFEGRFQISGSQSLTPNLPEVPQESSQTQMGDTLIIDDSEGMHTIEAQGQKIVINGSDNTLIISGFSPSVVINGSSNMVIVKSAEAITVNGSSNTTKVDGGKPRYTDNGSGNLVLGL